MTEEQKARGREYKVAWQRARREERRAAGLCPTCGKPSEQPGRRCNACAAKDRARYEVYLAAARERRAAERKAAQDAPGAPFCPHCGGRDLMRAGHIYGKQRYRCRATGCGRLSYGRVADPRIPADEDRRCPNRGCTGRCVKMGRDSRGRQLYWCFACRKKNTRLWPTSTRKSQEGGPFPYTRTFYLGLIHAKALDAYCQRHNLSPAQAVRRLFRSWADHPLGNVLLARRVLAPAVAAPRERIPRRLPDLRRPATAKRMASGNRLHMTVLVTWKLGVALDTAAYQGLLRFMRMTGLSHQDAVRALILGAEREAQARAWMSQVPSARRGLTSHRTA